jgi:hypothetical protein
MPEISLSLDSYDDIYSDFDSRHYLKRRISEDFIDELKMSLKFKPEHIDNLVLLLPAGMRKMEIEKEIAINIKNQLHGRYEFLNNAAKRTYRNGLVLIVAGLVIMTINSLLSYKNYTSYLMTVLRVILEPASWFMIWNGLDFLIYEYRKAKKETEAYCALEQLKIHFQNA